MPLLPAAACLSKLAEQSTKYKTICNLLLFNYLDLYHLIKYNLMNTKTLKKFGILTMFCMVWSLTMFAQGGKMERVSPAATAKGNIGAANVTIIYSSPAVKGRTVWGDLVPYNKVWRAGANEATIFETDKPLTIDGKTLPAGKYSLYAIPGEAEWKVIFNSQTGQWGIKRTGETTDDASKDVLTVTTKAVKSAKFNERLSYVITEKGIELVWADLTVPVLIK